MIISQIYNSMEKQARKAENSGNSDNCKISVIIPVFNTEKYLRRCVDSVLSQTFRDFELILVDDCSTDGSPVICDEYARKDGLVKVIHNAQNQGSSMARKTGLDTSIGDYILFVDSDDWIESDMLEVMYNKAISDDLDMVYCEFYIHRDDKQREITLLLHSENKNELIKELLAGKFYQAIWYKLASSKIYKKIVFPSANIGEDIYISVQMLYYSKNIGYVERPLYHYYIYSDSLSNDDRKKCQKYTDLYMIMTWVIKFLYDKYNADFNIFEPELSNRVNPLKLCFVQEKQIRNASVFHELYPASNCRIFNPAWRETFANKVILFLSVHDKTFILADIFNAVYQAVFHSIRSVYRIIVPRNLRDVIWHKRNKATDT